MGSPGIIPPFCARIVRADRACSRLLARMEPGVEHHVPPDEREKDADGWLLRPELFRVSVFFVRLHGSRTRTLSPVGYGTGTDC
jgi:hypothetical protein